MARRIDRLTDRTIKAKKAKGYYAGGDGLYLQVTATGARSWVFRFKLGGKPARDMGLGGYPTVSLAEARQRAKEAREHRDADRDPITARDAAAAQKRLAEARGTTFRECAEKLIGSNEAGWRNARHRQQWANKRETYVYPVLGDMPVAAIDTALVLKVIEPIWPTKTETASRVRGRIERVLSSAKARGLRDGENPAAWRGHLAELLPKRSLIAPAKHHPALPYRDVPAFMAKLRSREGVTARALESTILTAARIGETLGETFVEFDGKAWTVHGKRMKTGEPHRVPLCPRAVAIVKDMAAAWLNDFVFPSIKRGEPTSPMAMLMLLRDLRPGITVHGFRSSFRDWAGEQTNAPHDICEAALAHKRGKVHGAYQRGDLFNKRDTLMQAWAEYCEPPSAEKKRRASKSARQEKRRASVTAM